MFRKVDDWLIDEVFQRMSDWSTDRFGKSNFWLAKVCFWTALTTLSALTVMRPVGHSWLSLLFFVLIGFWMLYKIREMERLDSQAAAAQTRAANSMRIDLTWQFMRILVLVLAVLVSPLRVMLLIRQPSLREIIWFVDDIAWIGFMYFSACTPRPPRPLRVAVPLGARTT